MSWTTSLQIYLDEDVSADRQVILLDSHLDLLEQSY